MAIHGFKLERYLVRHEGRASGGDQRAVHASALCPRVCVCGVLSLMYWLSEQEVGSAVGFARGDQVQGVSGGLVRRPCRHPVHPLHLIGNQAQHRLTNQMCHVYVCGLLFCLQSSGDP